MIISFKTKLNGKPSQFVDKIILGEKIHTIRVDQNKRWKAGNSIQFATGVRTKEYRHFMSGECISVQEIKMLKHTSSWYRVLVDGRELKDKEIDQLLINDGLESFDFFFQGDERVFKGRLIHWTGLRY